MPALPGLNYKTVPAQPEPEPEQVQLSRGGRAPSQMDRVTEIERITQATLPTQLVKSLSELQLSDPDRYKAAKLAARLIDLPPAFMWGDTDLGKLTDPLHGGQMRLSTINRLSEGMEPYVIAQMLPDLLTYTETEGIGRGRAKDVKTQIDAKRFSRYLRALVPLSKSHEIEAETAFGLAAELARKKIDPKTLGQNISVITAYDAELQRSMTMEQVIGLAIEATEQGRTLTDYDDLAAFLLPEAEEMGAERASKREEQIAFAISQGYSREGAEKLYAVQGTSLSETGPEDEAKQMLAYGEKGSDLLKTLEEVQVKLYLDTTAWERSFLGRAWTNTLKVWDQATRDIQKAAVAIGTPIAGTLVGLPPGGRSVGEAWQDAYDLRDRLYQGFNEGKHLGRLFVDETGAPEWLAAPMDFFFQVAFDPTIIGGKLLTGLRAGKLVTTAEGVTILTRPTFARALGSKLTGGRISPLKYTNLTSPERFARTMETFVNGKRADRLYKAMMASDDALLKEMRRWTKNYEARTAFDEHFMFSMAKKLRESGLDESALRTEFRQGMLGHFGQAVPEGSLAYDVFASRVVSEADNLKSYLENPREHKQLAFEELDEVITREVTPLALRLEIPRPRLPGLGRGAIALKESGIPGAKLLNTYGGSIVKLHGEVPLQVERTMRRAGLFSEAEIAERVATVARASKGIGFESRIVKELDDVVGEVARRQAAKRGLPKDLVDDLLKELTESHAYANRDTVFGIISHSPEGRMVSQTTPILETQLRNVYWMVDPLDVKRLVNRYTGALNRLKLIAKGTKLKELKHLDVLKGSAVFDALDTGREIWKGVVRSWKFSVVPRPAYVARVVLGDEAARFLATTGGVFERIVATNLEDAAQTMGGVVLNPLPLITPAGVGKAVGKYAAGKPLKATVGRFLDWLFPDEKLAIKMGDDVAEISFAHPGKMSDEALANTAWREADIIDDVARRRLFNVKFFSQGQWGAVKRGARNYNETLARALRDQLGFSKPGREALESVIRGETSRETASRLRAWASVNRDILTSLNISDIETWAETVSAMAHRYTGGDKVLAQAALDRASNIETYIRAVPDEFLPAEVHGQLLESLTMSNQGLKRYVDYWYDVFVRMPENVLNRQPFYKTWKARAERVYAGQFDGPISAEAKLAIDQASREFALAQVKRIMFDFTEQTRIGELLGFFAPFMQPFLEAYAVWGHILIHRAPQTAGYVKALGKLGMDSGFLRHDPDSGELVIPTSWWMGQSALLELALRNMPGEPIEGIQMFTYLDSLNLFFSSSTELPTTGLIGEIAGGANIPVPALSPWAGILIRHFFKDTDSTMLGSYLFQFGYNTPILPAHAERILKGIAPEWFGEDINRAVEKQVAAYFEARGVVDEWIRDGVNTDEIQARIVQAAQNLQMMRGWLGLFQLGATKWNFPTSDIEDELWALRALPEEGGLDYEEGTKEWLKRHPDNALLTVGTRRFGPEITDPETGERAEEDGEAITGGVRVPYSELTQALLRDPEFSRLANVYPQIIGAVILEADPELANEFSFNALSQLIAEGYYKPKSLDDIMAEGEAVGPKGFWSAVKMLGQAIPLETIEDQFGEDSIAYTEAKQHKAETLLVIYKQFPFYAPRKLELVTDENSQVTGARFKSGEDLNPNHVVMSSLRQFAREPSVQHTQVVQGLKLYFEGSADLAGRDDLALTMSKRGISSLDVTAAEGIRRQYDKLVKTIETTYPYAYAALSGSLNIIGQDLMSVMNAADRKLDRWQKSEDPKEHAKYQTYANFRVEYDRLYREGEDPDYDAIRAHINKTMSADPWVMDLWFKTKPAYKREEYRQNLVTLNPLYYSRFDWKQMGVKLTKQAAGWISDLVEARAMIPDLDDEATRRGMAFDFSSSELYEALDVAVAVAAKQDKSFAQAVNSYNEWGWTFKMHGLADQPHDLGEAWGYVLDLANQAQGAVDQLGLTGYEGGTEAERAAYANIYVTFKDWVEDKKQAVPAFGAQWDGFDDAYSGDLFDLLMPHDFYFRLGSVEKDG